MKPKTKSILALFLAALVWGFAFVAQRVGADALGPYTFNAIRFALGALSLVPVILLLEHQSVDRVRVKQTIWPGLICGILLFTASTLQQYGVMLTDFAGKSGFITDFYIILVPFFSVFLHQKTSRNAWLGAILALVGFYFLCMHGTFTINIGDLLLFACACFFAVHILAIDRVIDRVYPLRLSCIQFFVSAVLSACGAILLESFDLNAVKQAAIPLLYGGIISVGGGYTLQAIGQTHVDSATSAIILSSESVFCALGSAWLLHEIMRPQAYFGCLLVCLGILLAQLPMKKTGSQRR